MNQFLEAATIALQAIWSNKLRSLLTVLGNIVAVTSIIAVVSLVQGLNASVTDMIQSQFAADAFTVSRTAPARTEEEQQKQAGNPRLTMRDGEAIRAAGPSVAMVMAESTASAEVAYRGQKLNSVQIRGVSKEYNDIPSTQIEVGRPITPGEFDNGRFVTILGWEVADQLFPQVSPIDKMVTISGVRFQVAGVAAKKGTILGQSQDQFAVVPLPALQRVFGTRLTLRFTVRPTQTDLVQTAMDETRVALRTERRLRPKQNDNFGIVSSETFLNIYRSGTQMIFAVLIGVVSLSLVVGGIVIMNIMLMVVSERTREIGLRKSLGARRRDIMWQILTESITLSTFGGIIGTGLGFTVAWIISKVSPLPAIVEPWSVLLGISMTSVVGLFFGMYPAMRAARLDPIEALRRE
ncbi:MAG TPA: ABC transporter permease [Vicinamibacterales bacterium]|nr:ABC transporter permease [Vicinamibacterales bacterium]